MTIYSIVRIVEPGAQCSHPVGRHEVQFIAPYAPCLHSSLTATAVRLEMRGRSPDDAERQAIALCETFNRCRFADNLGFRYVVEAVDEESQDRAPPKD